MSYVMSPIEYTLNGDSSYDAFANLQVGSNGNINGTPTAFVNDSDGEENWAYDVWEQQGETSSFDTSTVSVGFDVTSDGNETLDVANNAPLTYQTGAIGPITSVTLEAAVQTNATAAWSGITIDFLQNGVVVEQDSFANGPQVNTVNLGSANVEDQTLTVTPSAPNDDEVLVKGFMRLTSPGINVPAPNAMFCNILINGGSANSLGSGSGAGINGNGNEG